LKWYSLDTKPRYEDSNALQLRNAGIEVINPKIRIKKYFWEKYTRKARTLFCFFFPEICYYTSEVSEVIEHKAAKTFSFGAFFIVSTPETLV